MNLTFKTKIAAKVAIKIKELGLESDLSGPVKSALISKYIKELGIVATPRDIEEIFNINIHVSGEGKVGAVLHDFPYNCEDYDDCRDCPDYECEYRPEDKEYNKVEEKTTKIALDKENITKELNYISAVITESLESYDNLVKHIAKIEEYFINILKNNNYYDTDSNNDDLDCIDSILTDVLEAKYYIEELISDIESAESYIDDAVEGIDEF